MNYWIVFNFEDGVICFIYVVFGEIVVDVVYCQGINIFLDCCDGVCGICKCLVEVGCYVLGQDYIDDVFSVEEVVCGYVLICQMCVESDCVLCVLVFLILCRIGQVCYEVCISEVW